MRQPKPWYWEKRKAWYVTIKGKQIKLHENEREANKIFYRIMADEGLLDGKQAARMTVADAYEAILAAVAHNRAKTKWTYEYMLAPFAAHFKNKRLSEVTPEQCIKFVADHQGAQYNGKTFGDASRALMFRHIKTLYRWARDTGIISVNPMAGVTCPWKIIPRQRPMTQEEYDTIMTKPGASKQFREVIEFIWRTGARPGEVAIISARHLDARLPIVRLQPTEHKTGTKTGFQREIFLPEDLMARLRSYAEVCKKGPLLRTKNGKTWTSKSMASSFIKLREKLGLPGDLVIHMARHGFITRLVESGTPIARAARLAGHGDTKTLMKHYYHPETHAMLGDVERADKGLSRPADPPAGEETSPGADE